MPAAASPLALINGIASASAPSAAERRGVRGASPSLLAPAATGDPPVDPFVRWCARGDPSLDIAPAAPCVRRTLQHYEHWRSFSDSVAAAAAIAGPRHGLATR